VRFVLAIGQVRSHFDDFGRMAFTTARHTQLILWERMYDSVSSRRSGTLLKRAVERGSCIGGLRPPIARFAGQHPDDAYPYKGEETHASCSRP
jgi:hypothetical protein